MADDYVQLNPDSSGKKIRTQSRTVGANTVHEQYTITTDESTGNTVRVLNAVPAATDYGLVTRPAPVSRQNRIIYAQAFATATTEALITTLATSLNFATATTGLTTVTVTTGKTYRIQAIVLANRLSTTTSNWVRINVRVNTGGTAVVTSPIVATATATWFGGTAAANQGTQICVPFPDGLEIPAGASIGVGQIGAAATGACDVALMGYEYS